MASLCINSISPPPSHLRRDHHDSPPPSHPLKPIVVMGNPPTFVSAPDRRIVAVGDLHGDLAKARSAFEMAGILSSEGPDLWTGGNTVLVQLGDILDRGQNELAILSLLKSLSIQAKSVGGAVFQVNGNHETMNVEGDFRYVDPGGFDEFADFLDYLEAYEDWDEAFLGWTSESGQWRSRRHQSQTSWKPWNLVKRQKGVLARSSLLRPGGLLACELAQHGVILKVNDWVFCHGGLLPHHVAYGIERINMEVSQWMQGYGEDSDEYCMPFIATRGYDSVVWNRLYSRDPSNLNYRNRKVGAIVEETLERAGAKAMVVGHTPQLEGVNCKYNNSIWRIDVGMSRGVMNSNPEVLEINNNKARAIRNELYELQEIEYL